MKKRFITLVMLGVMAVSTLTACGNKDDEGRTRNKAAASDYEEYMYEPSYMADAGATEYAIDDGDYYYEEPSYEEADTNGVMQTSKSQYKGSTLSDDDNGAKNSDTQVKEDKMVYEANLTIETLDFDKTYSDLLKLIDECGGRIDSEEYDAKYQSYTSDSRYKDGYHTTKQDYLVIRIPADKYQDFMNSDETLGNVIGKNQNTSNISQQYYSTETRIELLEGQLEYYKHQLELIEEELMDVEDYDYVISQMIYLEDRIIDVQDEINMYKNNIVTMDSQVDYATIRLTLSEVKEYTEIVTPREEKKNTFANRFKKNAKAAFKGFTKFCENILYGLMFALPYIIITAIVTLIIVLAAKKHKKNALKKIKVAPYEPLPEALPSVAKKMEEEKAENAKVEETKKEEENK